MFYKRPKAKHFAAAFDKGFKAAKNCESIENCPYELDERDALNTTWNAAWVWAWQKGYMMGGINA